jgi:hypothetical protein
VDGRVVAVLVVDVRVVVVSVLIVVDVDHFLAPDTIAAMEHELVAEQVRRRAADVADARCWVGMFEWSPFYVAVRRPRPFVVW